jgi:hypothetical protein
MQWYARWIFYISLRFRLDFRLGKDPIVRSTLRRQQIIADFSHILCDNRLRWGQLWPIKMGISSSSGWYYVTEGTVPESCEPGTGRSNCEWLQCQMDYYLCTKYGNIPYQLLQTFCGKLDSERWPDKEPWSTLSFWALIQLERTSWSLKVGQLRRRHATAQERQTEV